ncbi:hypothetical protein B0I35DRAFT_446703 [Stachybotrys elegans]|uniref:F-box domain-containing protein n=1 Tax=Stachybotrys elegans TaxID=80388 RepID=A0A8K0SGM1_9HYPO|nr:hypothetical protein B0I35DRAFT_446703 [Stachybotrys elegans]
MAAPILSCPTEVLHYIISSLNPFDVEAVAKTFNRTLFNVACPILLRHKPWLDNVRLMTGIFPPRRSGDFLPSFPGHVPVLEPQWSTYDRGIPGTDYTFESLGIRPATQEYVASSPPDLRSWMQLDGSFDWLKPLDERMQDMWEEYVGPFGESAPGADDVVNGIMEMAKKLDLVLPDGFETFMKSKELHYRIPSCMSWYFELAPIAKAPKALDGGAGGYVVKFHIDQQSFAYSYIYLHPSGGHCVFVSRVDWCEEPDADLSPSSQDERRPQSQEEGEQEEVADELAVSLHSLSFEEYLATVYYEQLLWYGVEPFDGLKAYVAHVYRPRQ